MRLLYHNSRPCANHKDTILSVRGNKVFTFIPGFETRGFPVHFDNAELTEEQFKALRDEMLSNMYATAEDDD